MKRAATCVAVALVATLAMGAMTGCGNQASSTNEADSSSAATTEEATTEAASTQDEIIAELKETVAKPVSFKSVTVTEKDVTTYTGKSEDAEGEKSEDAASSEDSDLPDVIEATSISKFDASGDTLKTSVSVELGDIKIAYYSDGDKAVCVTDGPSYSGTTEQFDIPNFQGYEAYFAGTFGELGSIVDCIDSVTKEQRGEVTIYTLTLDVDKYIKSDEVLQYMADNGNPVLKAVFTLGYDQEGRLVSADRLLEFKEDIAEIDLTMSDFDTTTVEALPEATNTYEEMQVDMQVKLDETFDEQNVDTAATE